jgi:hypothetical protein
MAFGVRQSSSGRALRPAAVRKGSRAGPRIRSFRPHLEAVEHRRLLSTSIPLNPTTWTAIGPAPIQKGFVGGGTLYQPFSGRINAIASDPVNANVIYIAATGGGVWKTTNGGVTWLPLTDSQPTLFMGSIAPAPSNPSIIYAGTGEADNGDFYGRGVLKSADGGATWTLLGNSVFDRSGIIKIVVDPANPDTVYVAIGLTFTNGLSGNHGIWKSTDGGLNWTNTTVNSGITGVAYTDLAMDPANAQHLFAAAGTSFGAPGNGLYETLNGGSSWALSTGGGTFPSGAVDGRIELTISPSSPQTLYASIADPVTDALFALLKSANGGASWTDLTANAPNYLRNQGGFDSALIVDPSNPNVVYVGGAIDFAPSPSFRPINSILESRDGGNTWLDITVGDAAFVGPHADQHGFAFDASGHLLDGNDGGIWRLDNPIAGSLAWFNVNGNLQITQFYGIALDPTDVNIAYGGSQDNGTERFDDSLGWTLIKDGDGALVLVDPMQPKTIYHTFFYEAPAFPNFIQRSDDAGVTWTDITTGIDLTDPGNFSAPVVMDPTNPNRLILATNRLYESLDRGDHWAPITTPASVPIRRIAVSKSDPSTIYWSAGPFIAMTFDDGSSVQEIDLPNGSGAISGIQVDPLNNRVAYALRGNFGNGHVFRTADGGTTWTDISGNLPDLPANTIAVAPGSTALFVGNDTGVWVSYDLGASWSPFGAGLPHARVNQLELNAKLNVLAAGTFGRGMFEIAVPLLAQINGLSNVVENQTRTNAIVATFTDPLGNEAAGNYSATLAWGDGATSPGTIQANASGGFDVLGSHTYSEEGSFTLTVSLSDSDASSASGLFLVTVADASLTAGGTPISATEGILFSGPVATFSDADLNAPLSDFTTGSGGATLDWGDGAATAGVITQPGGVGTVFVVSGSHTYQDEGSQTVTVTINDRGSSTTAVVSSATIADAGLTVTAVSIRVTKGVAFSGPVATFSDAYPGSLPADFTSGSGGASIDWGDGTASSTGTISLAGTTFTVTGSHTFSAPGRYSPHITILDEGGSTATTNPPTANAIVGDDNQRYVAQAYLDVLQRPVDKPGLDFWAGQLDAGAIQRARFAQTLVSSVEFRSLEIQPLYTNWLHRTVDAPGLKFWTDSLAAGLPLEGVKSFIFGSDEYFKLHGSNNDSYLKAVYQDLFNRAIDSGGEQFWLDRMQNHGLTRVVLANAFVRFPEAENTLVKGYYQLYLHHAPDSAGLSFFSTALQKGTLRDEDVVKALVATDEYFARG